MVGQVTLCAPNVLNGPPEAAEPFLSLVEQAQSSSGITLDLSEVTWVCPYGVVLLLGVCRYLSHLSSQPVQIAQLRVGVHAYLRRVDFFESADQTAYTSDTFDRDHELARSRASANVLEVVSIAKQPDVYEVVNRARMILGYWLRDAGHDTDRIVSLLSEACSNVVDHSRDIGIVTIQKYERQHYVDVELAISDLGMGISNSLIAVHGEVANTPSGYIELALAGWSARSGRGGHGLGAIHRIATKSGGSLYVRSGRGSILTDPDGIVSEDGLAFFPGTQIAITFRSSA